MAKKRKYKVIRNNEFNIKVFRTHNFTTGFMFMFFEVIGIIIIALSAIFTKLDGGLWWLLLGIGLLVFIPVFCVHMWHIHNSKKIKKKSRERMERVYANQYKKLAGDLSKY